MSKRRSCGNAFTYTYRFTKVHFKRPIDLVYRYRYSNHVTDSLLDRVASRVSAVGTKKNARRAVFNV